MKILGIHDGHNATAALLIDGKVVAMVSEERFSYKKNDFGFPLCAIGSCLKTAGISAQDLDIVAFSTRSIPLHYMRIKRESLFTIRDYLDEQEHYWKPLLFDGRVNKRYFKELVLNPRFKNKQVYDFKNIPYFVPPKKNQELLSKLRTETLKRYFSIPSQKVKFYDHHVCHQYYAYFASPYRDASVLVVTADGGGDGANGTVSIAHKNVIKELSRNNHTDLARIYRYITLLLGMRIGEHEYKVMGLAPYTSEYEVRKCDKAFKRIFKIKGLAVEYKNRPKDLFFHFRDILADCRFDGIAGGVQQMIEEVGTAWFAKLTQKLAVKQVVFSGGLSMNVKLNKMIAELPSVDDFYCPASGGDESTALGACYFGQSQQDRSVKIESLENAYQGPDISRTQITKVLPQFKDCSVREGVGVKDIALLLSQGVVIGRMCGRMEFGARALGNRSILADPRNPAIVKKINQQIKFRDFWMPFAPSILDRYADKYLVNPKALLSDHMTLCFDTTALGRKMLAAAIHPADSTVRAQIVRKALNPDYYALIQAFANLTGVGAVLNTSFNLHGYPIVYTPEQALHVFNNSALDAVLMDDFLILRRKRS